ncbi:MAG: DUF4340 domain-containing protein [Spirochaetales bacterium]|nr:DUF4340 domain-containing protein [Spirochaetales bacterium]
MNKLKTWRELIILAAIAAVLLLYIIYRTAGNINYELPVLQQVDSESIDHITIEGPDTSLDFTRQDEAWLINPEGWIANQSMLKTITSAVANLKPADLISSSGALSKYNLDETQKFTVKIFSGSELQREIYVGKVSSSGIYTYVMFPGNKNIYSVRGDLPSRFGGQKSAMREKQILSVPRDGILKMSMKTDDRVMTMFKDGSGIWHAEGRDDEVDSSIKAAIPMLSPLRCTGFLESLPASGFSWTIDIQTTEGNVLLEVWPETAEGYPARSSQNGYPVLLTSYTTEKILETFGVVFE